MRHAACALIFAFAMCTGSTSSARADAIDGPRNCAPGTIRVANHRESFCADTRCAIDADCNPAGTVTPRACREVGVCVDNPGAYTERGRHTYGVCTPSCASGTCERAKRCVPAGYEEPGGGGGAGPAPATDAQSRGCACNFGGATGGRALAGALAAGACIASFVVARRRRSRRGP